MLGLADAWPEPDDWLQVGRGAGGGAFSAWLSSALVITGQDVIFL